MNLVDLLYEADLLGLRRLTWTETDEGWTCSTTSLRALGGRGVTPLEALNQLLRQAWRVR